MSSNTGTGVWSEFLVALQEYCQRPELADTPLANLHVVPRVLFWKVAAARERNRKEAHFYKDWSGKDIWGATVVSDVLAQINQAAATWTLAAVVTETKPNGPGSGNRMGHCTVFIYHNNNKGYIYDPNYHPAAPNEGRRLSRTSGFAICGVVPGSATRIYRILPAIVYQCVKGLLTNNTSL
jgi:hypothetical protein